MNYKRLVDVDPVSSVNDTDSVFINQGGEAVQVDVDVLGEALVKDKFDYYSDTKSVAEWQAWILENKKGNFCAPATISSTNNTQLFIMVTKFNGVDNGHCSMLVFNYSQTLYQYDLRNGTWREPTKYASVSVTDGLSARLTSAESSIGSKFDYLTEVKTIDEWKEWIVANKRGGFCGYAKTSSDNNTPLIIIVSAFNNYANGYCSMIAFQYNRKICQYNLNDGTWLDPIYFTDTATTDALSARVASLEENVTNMGTWKALTLGNGWTGALYARVDALNKQVFINGYVYASSSVTNFSFCQINSSANALPLPVSTYPLGTCGVVCVGTDGVTSTVYLYGEKHLTVRSTTTSMYWNINLCYRYS